MCKMDAGDGYNATVPWHYADITLLTAYQTAALAAAQAAGASLVLGGILR